MTVSTGSKALIEGAVARAPMLADISLKSPSFRESGVRLPYELDDLAAVLLEHDVDPGLRDNIVESYAARRLESAYGAAVQADRLRQAAVTSLMREFMP